MKKIIVSLLFLFILFSANAQTEKGDWMIGGYFRLNTSDNNTEFSLTPNGGLFIINNLAVGGNVTISYSKNGTRKSTDFGIGPFLRYYFTTARFRPILQGSLSFLTEKTKVNNVSSTNNGINYFLGGGAAIFISDQVSIDGLLGYYHSKVDGFNGGGGFAMNIGFQVYLLKKQVDRVKGN